MIDSKRCCGCGAEARLQCPKCQKLGIAKASSVFCSQECFKANWDKHKAVHKTSDGHYMFILNSGRTRTDHFPEWEWTGPLRPARVGPVRSVPDSIPKPDWAKTGTPHEEMTSWQQLSVAVREGKKLQAVREACQLGREILDEAHRHIKAGVTTDEIDRVVHDFTVEHGAYPSPRHYHHFPRSVCTSVNEVICHGIPDMRELEDGDIVNVDVSCMLNGAHGDLNETYIVGNVDSSSKKLVKVAYECLHKAIQIVKPGTRYRDIGDIISKHAQSNGFSVVRSYCGHGIGDLFHCAPNVPHFGRNKAKGIMQVGHTFTIEPMINAGTYRDNTWPDGWTAVTADGARSAQFEHALVVTPTGYEVMTKRTEESPPLWWEAEGVALDC